MKVFQVSILFSALLFGQTSCQSNSYQIKGTAEGFADGDTLFLTRDMQTGEPSDTIVIKGGEFLVKGETDSTSLCMIYSAKRNEINAPFFLEPGTISIHLSQQPGASRVGGTDCNKEWQELNDSVMVIGKEINKIAEHVYAGNLPKEEQDKGMAQIEQLNKRFAALVVNKADKNSDNEFGYFLLTYYPEELIDNATRSRLIKQLPDKMRQRPAIRHWEQTIAAAEKTAEGTIIANFSQQALDGTTLSLLEEVKKNKITIIDFWASWCGPCRQEMPFMVEMYNELKDRGFGIVGVSLDSDHDAWERATKQLDVVWPQMSDLKGWKNAIAQHFNVTSIPHTIVVDHNGKILRRGLRGDELKEFVEGHLK